MTARGIDPARSRIVLLGSASYDDDQLSDVPQISANLRDLTAVLTDPGLGGFPQECCVTIPPQATGRAVGQMLHRAANEAEDLLLFYFAGHGIPVGRSHELYLALHETAMDAVEYSALRFDTVRGTFLGSRARNRVIILDSCFSGRAIGTTLSAGQQELLGQLDIQGTYTLTSAPPNSTALVLADEEHTAFTGRLLTLLREGAPHAGPLITMQDIYRSLWTRFTAERLPLPQQRGTENADQLGLVLNRKAATGSSPTGPATLPWPPAHNPSADSLTSQHDRAVDLAEDGHSNEALALFEQVARERARVLGPDNPDTLESLHQLAISYSEVGRAQEASDLGRRVAEARTRVLGPEDPATLDTLHALTFTYEQLDREQEALDLRERVAEARTRVLGPEDPATLKALDVLALDYFSLGRVQEAVEVWERVARVQARVLDPHDPEALDVLHLLAIAYSALGRGQDASDAAKRAAQGRFQALGPEAPDTIDSFYTLALAYDLLDREQEALEMKLWVAEVRARVLGPEDPETLETLCSLALSYSVVGRDQEAVSLGERVADAYSRVLGHDDPATLDMLDTLTDLYNSVGRHAEARALKKRVGAARSHAGRPDTMPPSASDDGIEQKRGRGWFRRRA
ncbi:caspase, EACC1-associated type [[Kitasatospora] papulosa]|uniref:caspase, EACC1-associated type n=1 Tax=[Kitasatospora] papulosa TaxID=1464011 RepID=UPI0037180A3B